MAIINQLTTSNTFQEWLTSTTGLIDFNNQFVEGTNLTDDQFIVNSNLRINGQLLVTGNVKLDEAGFDNMTITGNLILSQDDTGTFFSTANTSGAATTRYVIDAAGSSAYTFDTHPTSNPTITLKPGHTYAFDTQKLSGSHPFVIRTANTTPIEADGNTYYNVGLTYVETDGTASISRLIVKTAGDAQGQSGGVLYWKVPANTVNQTFYYQCQSHPGAMNGILKVDNTTTAVFAAANNVISESLALAIALG